MFPASSAHRLVERLKNEFNLLGETPHIVTHVKKAAFPGTNHSNDFSSSIQKPFIPTLQKKSMSQSVFLSHFRVKRCLWTGKPDKNTN